MLARKQGGRRDDGHLLAIDGGAEGGAQRDLGLAKTNVAANQSIHRPAGGEIIERRIDGGELILGFIIRKARAEFVVESFRRGELRRLAQLPLRRNLDEPFRHFADAILHPRLARLPAGAAEPIELRFGVLATIARQEFDVFDRQIELVAASVVELEAIMRRAGGGDRLEADETADAVIDMHDEIAGGERGDFAEKIFVGLAFAAATNEAIAKNVLLAQNRVGIRFEAVFDPENGYGDGLRQRLRKRRDARQVGQAVFREHMAEPLAGALGPTGDDDRSACVAQRLDMVRGRLEDIDVGRVALGRKVAAGPRAAINDFLAVMRRERRELRRRAPLDGRAPFLERQIERAWLERLIV